MKEKSIIQQNLKKIIGVIVVSVFAIITIYTVFQGSGISLNELTASLKEASWEGILLASVSMLGFIYFEGEALRVLVRHMGYPQREAMALFIRRQMCIFLQLRHLLQEDSRQVHILC